MDEAFEPLAAVIRGLRATPEFLDEEAGIHLYARRLEIEVPIELDVRRGDDGAVQIGSTPPLYYVDTSLRPSYHRLRFIAEVDRPGDAPAEELLA